MLVGAFGTGNLGNDATLAMAVGRLGDGSWATRSVGVLGPLNRGRLPNEVPARSIAGSMPRLLAGRFGASRVGKALLKGFDLVKLTAAFWGTDLVVLPGRGVFEECMGGGPWGAPLQVALVALATRVSRSRLIFLSVGADAVSNPLSRRFFRFAARQAAYRSYRDEYSRDAMRSIRVETSGDPVVPDLVLAYQVERTAILPVHRSVGVGVIRYYGPSDEPETGQAVHQEYVSRISDFIVQLIHDNFTVKLLIGAYADLEAAHEIADVVSRQADSSCRLTIEDTRSFVGLVSVVRGLDALVVSRYHNLIAALLACKPTVSVGYGPKNADLMAQVGLLRFCQEIENLDPVLLSRQLHEAMDRSEQIAVKTAAFLSASRVSIEQQFVDVFSVEL